MINRITRRLSVLPPPPGDGMRHRLARGRKPAPKIVVRPERVEEGGFAFLNNRLPFAGNDRWLPAGASDLWRYQLHYFQYLQQLEPREAMARIGDWLALNPPGCAVAWDPGAGTGRDGVLVDGPLPEECHAGRLGSDVPD